MLISLDYDGTLFLETSTPPVHPAIHRALGQWRARQADWIINTGRSLEFAMEGLAQAGFTEQPAHMITREREIFTRDGAGGWVAFGEWNAHCEAKHHGLLARAKGMLHEVKQFMRRETRATFLELPEEPAGVVASNPEELSDICAFIDSLLPDIPDMRYERNSIYLRFSHVEFTKGSALAHLAGALGLSPDSVFAAGDNFNDLTMLDPAVAGHLACPSNAIPEVRAHVAAHGGYCARFAAAEGTAAALDELLARRA